MATQGTYHTQINKAQQEFYARQARTSDPVGRSDHANRWYPEPVELRDCCKKTRQPSRTYPNALLVHCRTAEHIAMLYGVEPRLLNALVRSKRYQPFENFDFYKIVIVRNGEFISPVQHKTTWKIGKSNHCHIAYAGPGQGFHVVTSEKAAYSYKEWLIKEYHIQEPMAILRCKANGLVDAGLGEVSFTEVTPVELIYTDDPSMW